MGDSSASVPAYGTHTLDGDFVVFFRALNDLAPYPIAILAGDTQSVLCANRAFDRLFGTSPESPKEVVFCTEVTERVRFSALLQKVLHSGQCATFREDLGSISKNPVRVYTVWPFSCESTPSGVVIQIFVNAYEETSTTLNEALIIGSLRQHQLTENAERANALLDQEIKERKQIEKSLHLLKAQLLDRAVQLESLVKQRTTELTETNAQLESFVYAVAHDLRAPLRAMQGFAEILTTDAGACLSERTKDCATRINKAAQFMDALLIDLLTFSQISQQRLQLSPVHLAPVVEAVLARMSEELKKQQAREEHPGPWPHVLAHEPTLHQVLFNLASNALKFNKPGAPPSLTLRSEARPGGVRVWVEDHGIGIAAAYQSQIFMPFTRLNGEKYAGTGIGLAIVKKGIERMGGKVGVESVEGVGSRFWIELKTPSPSP